MTSPRVAVVADDLIWSTRLASQLRAIGAQPVAVRDLPGLETVLPTVEASVVDLTARAYDGIEAVRRAAAGGRRVLAIGQHDDAALRRRAVAAGAERVLAYRKLAEDGSATLDLWLADRRDGSTPAVRARSGRQP